MPSIPPSKGIAFAICLLTLLLVNPGIDALGITANDDSYGV